MKENLSVCVLDKHKLKLWIYKNGFTQPYIAFRMELSPEEFKRKLREKDAFKQYQLRGLVHLMGAKAAFEVICFPTERIRQRVWQEVFGDEEKGGDHA